MDRCLGCGVCAMGCPADAIQRIEKPEPVLNREGLREAMASSF